MRKPYNYRELSPKTLTQPRYRHLFLALGWIGYFLMYMLTERLIPPERCTPIHCGLDDLIPFCEYFAVFYVGWYALVFGALLYTLVFNVESFKGIQKYIIITQVIAMICYVFWPSRQDLRPEQFPRENFFTWLMGIIYTVDTPTGVCPSLHVGYSLGILSAGLKDRELKPGWKALLTFVVVMISVSVCFVKQHSALDVLFALPMCLLAEALVYGRSWWLPRLKPRNAQDGRVS